VNVDPQLHDHVETMVRAALARDGVLDTVSLSEALGKAPHEAYSVLASLAAGGLLCPVGEAAEHPPAYCLARAPDAIRLHEVSAAAACRGAHGSGEASGTNTAADNSVRSLSVALHNRTDEALARLTLADVLPRSVGDSSADASWAPVEAYGPATPPGPHRRKGDRPAPGWPPPTRLGMTVDDLWRLVDDGAVPAVIDVRSSTDRARVAPPWAHWLALEDFSGHTLGWPADTCIVNVCDLGMRSLIAATYLRWHGYSRAYYLIGGLEAWHHA